MQVQDVMQPDPITIGDDRPLGEAVRTMRERGIRHLPVVRGRALIGVLSERDLLADADRLAAHLQGDEVEHAPRLAREAMAAQPVTIESDAPLATAAEELARWGIGCLPVVRGRELVGIVTESDVLEAYVTACESGLLAADDDPPLGLAMTRELVRVRPSDDQGEAARRMRDGDFRHLPVVEDGRLVGLVSDRDLARAAGSGAGQEEPVAACMTPPPAALGPGDPLSRAASRMARERLDAIQIQGKDGRLAGLVTSTDVLEHVGRVLG